MVCIEQVLTVNILFTKQNQQYPLGTCCNVDPLWLLKELRRVNSWLSQPPSQEVTKLT